MTQAKVKEAISSAPSGAPNYLNWQILISHEYNFLPLHDRSVRAEKHGAW